MARKKFKFPLDALLRVRRIEENRAMADLAKVMVRVNEQEAVKENSARMLREETQLFEQKHRDDFSLDLFKTYDLYLERLESEALQANRKLAEIQPELEVEKAKVMDARRKRRVVELLRERAETAYKTDQRRADRKELLEINAKRKPLFERDEETTHADKRDRDVEEDREVMELERQREREQELDAVAEYFEKLGVPDPRNRRR